jgi:hypothetical protein
VKVDLKKSHELMKRAAELGEPRAIAHLKNEKMKTKK